MERKRFKNVAPLRNEKKIVDHSSQGTIQFNIKLTNLKFFSLVDFLVDIVFDGYTIINLNLNNFELVVQTYEVNPLVILSTLPS